MPAELTPRRAEFNLARSIRFLEFAALACVVACGCMAAALIAHPPGNDAAEYPAISLVQSGKVATAFDEAKGGTVPGRDQIVYYMMLPGHPLTSVPVIAIFGTSLTALRLEGLLFMSPALLLVFGIFKLAGLPHPYSALAMALVSLNRKWLQASVISRPEPQAFFFGLVGASLFVRRGREQEPLGAALGGVLNGLSVISHVNGIMFGFFCLAAAVDQILKNVNNTLAPNAGGLVSYSQPRPLIS